MHRDKDEPRADRLEATEDMWDDAGHPGWDALEEELDDMPPPTMTGEVTFGEQSVSRLSLWWAKRTKQKKFALQVVVHQKSEPVGGWYSCSVGPAEEKAALAYCKQFFEEAGFKIDDITIHQSGAGIGRAVFYLTVTTT
ncbi:TPA: hypothetical protein DCF80_02395 [Candidatus Saccharibacteria bacterium]|nr:hypothetical protein [Candidatus Saccharibacteria bacterium]HRK41050.1 hypothetical protein [Candidatus Saccharibacteria bacterium]